MRTRTLLLTLPMLGCAASPEPTPSVSQYTEIPVAPSPSAPSLEDEVVRRWHAQADQIARRIAAPGYSFESVRRFLDKQMSAGVLTRVTRGLQVDNPELERDGVQGLWAGREGGRWREASYGAGTWLLGEDAVPATVPAKEESAEEGTGRQKERRDFEEKIERWLADQAAAREAKRGDVDRAPSQPRARVPRAESAAREAAWQQLSTTARLQWILAYYAEHGGDMQVRPASEAPSGGTDSGTDARRIEYR